MTIYLSSLIFSFSLQLLCFPLPPRPLYSFFSPFFLALCDCLHMLSRDRWGQHPTYSRHSEALTLVRKPLRRLAHAHAHTTLPVWLSPYRKPRLCSLSVWQRGWALEFSCQRLILYHGLFSDPPPPLPDIFRDVLAYEMFWHQLSGAQRNWLDGAQCILLSSIPSFVQQSQERP